MGVANDFTDPEHTALLGIKRMEDFYRTIGMPVSIKELIGREISEEEIEEMVRKCSHGGSLIIGNFKKLASQDMKNIYHLASK